MIAALSSFRILNLLYQAISTFLVYWLSLFDSSYIAISRELIWCLIVFIVFIIWFSQVKSYRQKWKWSRYSFIILGIVSVLFSLFIDHTSFGNIFIGLKYWFQWIFILLTSTFLWFVLSQKIQPFKLFQKLPRILVWIIWVWFLRQWAKLLWPDFFFSLWYWSLDDYAYWDNPPIYYLTWYEWTLRWQWLFSWPNNYGYFLVAFSPLIWSFFSKKIKNKSEHKILHIFAIVARVLAMIMTLSRAVLIWWAVALVWLYRRKLKQHKKFLLRWWIWIFIALSGLSVLKRESTLGHIASKVDVIPEIISHPLWHWLWSSGPAIHYDWKFLPESYYFQILLDIGTVGFIIRVVSMLYLIRTQYNIIRSSKNSESENYQLELLHAMTIWWFSLLTIWLFLHVFEDSMVNYLFFMIYGIVLGSLSKNIRGGLWWKIQLKNRLS